MTTPTGRARPSAPVAAVLAGLVLVGVSCSSETPAPSGSSTSASSSAPAGRSPLVEPARMLPAAVAAVEAARGGRQRYTDLNVTPDGVNVFVALDGGREVVYFWNGSRLDPPTEPVAASLPAFSLDGVDLTVGPGLVESVARQFPTGAVVGLALVSRADAGVVWTVGYRSAQGGLLTVLFGPRGGEPLGVIPST
jgi:hypothetical protein